LSSIQSIVSPTKIVAGRRTLQELDEEKKVNFESEKSRISVGMRLILGNEEEAAQGNTQNARQTVMFK
jgi:hypothetical protein